MHPYRGKGAGAKRIAYSSFIFQPVQHPMEEDPPPKKLKLGEARFERANPISPVSGGEPPIDVHQILQSTLQRTVKGEKPLDLGRRRSSRLKDYWLSMLLANATFLVLYLVLPHNPVMLIFLLAGIVISNLGLAWVMLFIMED